MDREGVCGRYRDRGDLIKRIVRVVHPDLRREEGARRDERQAEGRIKRRALAIHQRRVGEVDELGRGPEVEAADVLAQSGQGELRGAAVRDHDRIVRVLQDLEPLYPRRRGVTARVPPLAVVGQKALARQRGLRSNVDAGRKVAEIAVVGDFVQVESAKEGAIAVVAADQVHAIAAAIRDTVIREYLRTEIAFVILLQITELLRDLQSALFHVTRRQRQVVVRREIQVIRNSVLGPALPSHADRRREKARFALVIEREVKRGRRDDGQSLEVHARSAGGPRVAREIQFQLVGLDQPAVVARLAGGEGAVLDSVLAFTQEFDRLGLPARRKECLTVLRTRRESKIRFLEYSGRIPDRIPQRGALQGVAVALKAHVPAGFDVFVSFVIGQGVGPDRQVPSTQARVTLCARVLTGDTFDAIRVEDDWQGVRLGALLRRTPRLKSLPLCSHRDRTGQRKGQRRTAGKYARHIGEAWTWATRLTWTRSTSTTPESFTKTRSTHCSRFSGRAAPDCSPITAGNCSRRNFAFSPSGTWRASCAASSTRHNSRRWRKRFRRSSTPTSPRHGCSCTATTTRATSWSASPAREFSIFRMRSTARSPTTSYRSCATPTSLGARNASSIGRSAIGRRPAPSGCRSAVISPISIGISSGWEPSASSRCWESSRAFAFGTARTAI